MNWKKFLKPGWRKIVIFIIFLVISLFILSPLAVEKYSYQPSINFWYSPLYQLLTESEYNFQNCIAVYNLWPSCYGFDYSGVSVMIISFLLWYLLSCLIVWFYDKFRKKKKIRH